MEDVAAANVHYISSRPSGTVIKIEGYKSKALYYMENGTFEASSSNLGLANFFCFYLLKFDAIYDGQKLSYNSTIPSF